MASTTDIRVTVLPEAAARIAELGMHLAYEAMLRHALETIPNLQSVEVQLSLPYDTGGEPGIFFEATLAGPLPIEASLSRRWGRWQVRTFPPEVCEHFQIGVVPGPNHAG